MGVPTECTQTTERTARLSPEMLFIACRACATLLAREVYWGTVNRKAEPARTTRDKLVSASFDT
ncbi:hypothetical protein BaRGS_00019368, partial [Batillaria attramentaria]